MSFDERVASIPVHVSSDVELTQGTENGSNPVLFWVVEGAIRVHPSRLETFRRMVTEGRLAFLVPHRTG